MVFNCIRENTSSAIQTNDAKVEKIKNWESEKKGEFISNINIEDINELACLFKLGHGTVKLKFAFRTSKFLSRFSTFCVEPWFMFFISFLLAMSARYKSSE
jgi:hypothetical protein